MDPLWTAAFVAISMTGADPSVPAAPVVSSSYGGPSQVAAPASAGQPAIASQPVAAASTTTECVRGSHVVTVYPWRERFKAWAFRRYAGDVEMVEKTEYPPGYYGSYYYQPWKRDWVRPTKWEHRDLPPGHDPAAQPGLGEAGPGAPATSTFEPGPAFGPPLAPVDPAPALEGVPPVDPPLTEPIIVQPRIAP